MPSGRPSGLTAGPSTCEARCWAPIATTCASILLDQVKTIGDLTGLRRALPDAFGVETVPITTGDLLHVMGSSGEGGGNAWQALHEVLCAHC